MSVEYPPSHESESGFRSFAPLGPPPLLSPQSYLSPHGRATGATWMSLHPSMAVTPQPSMSMTPHPSLVMNPLPSRRQTSTTSTASHVHPLYTDVEERTECMTVDPNCGLESVGSLDVPVEEAKKHGFVGGFVRKLRSFPRAVFRGQPGTESSPRRRLPWRRPSGKGRSGTTGSPPRYTETAGDIAGVVVPNALVVDGVAPSAGSGISELDIVRQARSQITEIPVSDFIPELDETNYQETDHHQHEIYYGPQQGSSHWPNSHQFITAGLIPSPIPSIPDADGEATFVQHQIHPSPAADLSPETVIPAPTPDYDHMAYSMRTPTETSLASYLSRLL